MQPVLKVNLTNGEVGTVTVPETWQQHYLGGASLAARLLYDRLRLDLDPLSPEAPLLFLNGPLSGTAGPAVGRFVICARSPATGLWGESNCGGFWGPELRMAGYDGLWVEGAAAEPVILWIHNDRVEIRPAAHLGGLDTYATQAAVEQELAAGKVRVAAIGPAGERRVPFALVLCDHGRVAGRTGMGAVMGAKNLKAVAVKGSGKIPVAETSHYQHLRSEANRNLHNDGVTKVLRELGTAGVVEYFDYLGEMPKRYFRQETFFEDMQISGSHIKENLLVGVSACHACVIACGRVVRLEDGRKRKGPEYETLVGFGPNLWLNDPVLATRLGELCDRYGMDSISMSNTLGLAFRLFELGKITSEDTGRRHLRWGEGGYLEELVRQTAFREGFGAFLSEGALSLARHFGAEQEAIQVNGLEVPYHDPRGASGMALVYATSPRGACHNQSDYFLVEVGQVESDLGLEVHARLGGAEKAANVAIHQDWRTVFNSLVTCIFPSLAPQSLVQLVNAACGLCWSLPDLLRSGERGWNLKRAINHRLGLTGLNDSLPRPLLIPYSDSARGQNGYVPEFEAMRAAYYAARGWDPATGYPTTEKLLELGLDFVARDLRPVPGS